jgi:hypothetical protein
MSSIARVRGMMDLGEAALRRRGFIDAAFATVTNCYQFVGLQTPIVEPAQLFSRSLGAASELVRKEMFLLSSVKKKIEKKNLFFLFLTFFFVFEKVEELKVSLAWRCVQKAHCQQYDQSLRG